MPVLLESIHCPSDQDLIDLKKIYHDYPKEGMWSLVEERLDQDAVVFYGGRFNDRLLGAFCLIDVEGKLFLDHLCVRKVTRRRRVAKEMLRQLFLSFDRDVFLETSCLTEELTGLLSTMGFVKTEINNEWVKCAKIVRS